MLSEVGRHNCAGLFNEVRTRRFPFKIRAKIEEGAEMLPRLLGSHLKQRAKALKSSVEDLEEAGGATGSAWRIRHSKLWAPFSGLQ
jgi:hypothetical protein